MSSGQGRDVSGAAYCNGQICRKLHIVSLCHSRGAPHAENSPYKPFLGSAMPVAEVENCWCKPSRSR